MKIFNAFKDNPLLAFIAGALVVGGIWYVDGTPHNTPVLINGASSTIQSSDDSTGGIFSVASSTGDTYFLVADNGNVGVNTLTPVTNLDVVGTIRAWHAFAPPCTAALEGAIVYERLQKHFIGCMPHGTGYDWHILDN